MQTIHTAAVINGALKLDDPVELPQQSRATVSVAPTADAVRRKEILKKFFELSDKTPLFGEGRRLTRDELHERP